MRPVAVRIPTDTFEMIASVRSTQIRPSAKQKEKERCRKHRQTRQLTGHWKKMRAISAVQPVDWSRMMTWT